REAAAAGVGIVELPDMMVTDELASGTLVKVMPEWQPKSGIVHAVFPSRRGLLPSVRKLIDFLAQRFGQIEEA
ncbi:MAG: LysR family transcriptional regulator, partial [Paraburkholderia sp.]|nr:LysR family transcriptional regulator [Paraburkholderia sp.]